MSRLRIPSPAGLVTFEAAGRHLSFTSAAEELCVSQAAVSSAIKSLEGALGVDLFVRQHKRIVLTEAGKRFYSDVALGLGHIARSAEAVRRTAEEKHVVLSSSTAFASHWLIPRLPSFRVQHPEIEIRIQTADRDTDLGPDPHLIGVRRGLGDWPNYRAFRFGGENLIPVCSPGYLTQSGAPRDLLDLAGRTLIHLDEPHRPRPAWKDWFAHFGIDFTDLGEGLRLNDYSLVVQAAIGGQGIALGWTHIIDHPLSDGLLVPALAANWETGYAFFIVSNRSVDLAPEAKLVKDWIIDGAPD
ncbi:LysR substrate-binding domain-containing protein [Mesorhizobium sp.]|uniref:LysR substrate-binding domain-containing protein n=1 Tax=Mesorhizobium sp. TaxID=1871066 RepID=UPI0025C1F310|nr:LysR substrate-binding domain-containing protein [Mesorhizobium sp.]